MAVKQIRKSDIIAMIAEGVMKVSQFRDDDRDGFKRAKVLYDDYMQPEINRKRPVWLSRCEACVGNGQLLHAVKIFKTRQENYEPTLREAKDAVWKYKETGNWDHWAFDHADVIANTFTKHNLRSKQS
jgi:hypothetical protein